MSEATRDMFLFWFRVLPLVLAFSTSITCAHAGGKWKLWALIFLLEGVGIFFAINVNDWQSFRVVLFRNTASILCSTRIYYLASHSRQLSAMSELQRVINLEPAEFALRSKDTLLALKMLKEKGETPLKQKENPNA
jgi:hypothetical protein